MAELQYSEKPDDPGGFLPLIVYRSLETCRCCSQVEKLGIAHFGEVCHGQLASGSPLSWTLPETLAELESGANHMQAAEGRIGYSSAGQLRNRTYREVEASRHAEGSEDVAVGLVKNQREDCIAGYKLSA